VVQAALVEQPKKLVDAPMVANAAPLHANVQMDVNAKLQTSLGCLRTLLETILLSRL